MKLPHSLGISAAPTVLLVAVRLAQAQEAHGEASPSLFAGDLGNAVWTLVIFVLLLVVLGRFAWKPILNALQSREEFIRKSLRDAESANEAAQETLGRYQHQLEEARHEAGAIVEEGRRDAEVVRRKLQEDARKEADAMIERARREIGVARDTAVKELYDLTGSLATEMAGKIIHRELDSKEHERLIAESLSELERMSGNGAGPK